MKRIILSVASVVALAGLATACGEKPAEVVKSGNHSDVVKSKPGSKNKPAADTAPADETAHLGDTVKVGDWSVKVTEVALNANEAIHKANMFNDKPKKGQYVLVTYSATYTGKERTADADSDLMWTLTGTDHKVNDSALAVTPGEDQDWPTEARAGGTVKGQAVFDVAPKNLSSAIVSVEGYTKDFDEVYADFAL